MSYIVVVQLADMTATQNLLVGIFKLNVQQVESL